VNPVPSLCVIVPTYHRPQDLADILACLKPQIEQEHDRRLVVVNDGTHDEAYAQVVRKHLTWMTYIPHPKNGGPGAARNVAAREVKEDFIVMTDDDCRPPLTWLDHIQGRLEADPWLDGLAGYTRPFFHNPKSLKERLIAESRVLPGATYDEVGRLTCAVTAAFAIRRSFYEQVGGFDERFRPSGEDLDLTQRLLRAGAIIEADPNWWTGHSTNDTLKAYFKRYFTYGEGSARYAFERQDWLHPDLRNYLDDDDAERAVKAWASSAKSTTMWKKGNLIEKALIAWFMREVAENYAAGFAAGVEKFAPAGVTPPREPWLRWPRLGLAPDGLLRR
jgi:glycosyltransferase involved in cell wall biosynthesis